MVGVGPELEGPFKYEPSKDVDRLLQEIPQSLLHAKAEETCVPRETTEPVDYVDWLFVVVLQQLYVRSRRFATPVSVSEVEEVRKC